MAENTIILPQVEELLESQGIEKLIVEIDGELKRLGVNLLNINTDEITSDINDLRNNVAYVGETNDDIASVPHDADTLGGKTEDMLSVAKAVDSDTLGGKDPIYYIQPRNILDNSDFTNPVNQRGATSYISAGYTIDRWRINSNSTLDVVDEGVKWTLNAAYSTAMYYTMYQIVPDISKYSILTLGLNVVELSGDLQVRLRFVDSSNAYVSGKNVIIKQGLNIVSLEVPDTADKVWVQIGNATTSEAGAYIVADWAALYEGSYTAETLPPYVSKGYNTEYNTCRWYLKRYSGIYTAVGVGFAQSATSAVVFIPEIFMQKLKPSVTWSGLYLCSSNHAGVNAIAITSATTSNAGGGMTLVVASSGLTVGEAVTMQIRTNDGYLMFSAEL